MCMADTNPFWAATRSGSPSGPASPATASAPPSEPLAASTASAGSGEPERNSTIFEPYTDDSTLPTIATPNAPPIWRVVSFTAEPTPALASGNEPMIDSVAGAIVSAMPKASSIMRHITWM